MRIQILILGFEGLNKAPLGGVTYAPLQSNFQNPSFHILRKLVEPLSYAVEPLYNGHLGDRRKLPLWRGLKQASMYGFFV